MTDKKQLIRNINASFENNNIEGFLDHCTDDINWTMAGEKSTTGKHEIREWMKSMPGECEPPKINVTTLIAEGSDVICHGDMTMKSKDGEPKQYLYCDIYKFSGDKIASLTTFVQAVKTEADSSSTAA